jgi:transcriptional regulator with XRE-family HTH domain
MRGRSRLAGSRAWDRSQLPFAHTQEFAERSGVQAGEVSRIERGKRDPQVSTVEKLAKAVETTPGRLLD